MILSSTLLYKKYQWNLSSVLNRRRNYFVHLMYYISPLDKCGSNIQHSCGVHVYLRGRCTKTNLTQMLFYILYSDRIWTVFERLTLVAENPDLFGWLVTLLFFFNYESFLTLVFVLVLMGWGWLLDLSYNPWTKF